MKAMVLSQMALLADQPEPLQLVERERPRPAEDELLIEVSVCGVCHTELDEIEGRLIPSRLPVIPGHEVIGSVVELGGQVSSFQLGDRVGVGWIHHSSGQANEALHDLRRGQIQGANVLQVRPSLPHHPH